MGEKTTRCKNETKSKETYSENQGGNGGAWHKCKDRKINGKHMDRVREYWENEKN